MAGSGIGERIWGRKLSGGLLKKSEQGRAAAEKNKGGGGPRYTYKWQDESGHGSGAYKLRGNSGTYTEEFYGDQIQGKLTYVATITWETEYGNFRGFVYNAEDELGQWCYFFGDEVIEDDLYILTAAEGHTTDGAPPPFDVNSVIGATRK